jgi:hypothetical protein
MEWSKLQWLICGEPGQGEEGPLNQEEYPRLQCTLGLTQALAGLPVPHEPQLQAWLCPFGVSTKTHQERNQLNYLAEHTVPHPPPSQLAVGRPSHQPRPQHSWCSGWGHCQCVPTLPPGYCRTAALGKAHCHGRDRMEGVPELLINNINWFSLYKVLLFQEINKVQRGSIK